MLTLRNQDGPESAHWPIYGTNLFFIVFLHPLLLQLLFKVNSSKLFLRNVVVTGGQRYPIVRFVSIPFWLIDDWWHFDTFDCCLYVLVSVSPLYIMTLSCVMLSRLPIYRTHVYCCSRSMLRVHRSAVSHQPVNDAVVRSWRYGHWVFSCCTSFNSV